MFCVCVTDVVRLKAVSVGVVVIKGEKTGRYLAMNKKGRLYGSVRDLYEPLKLQFGQKNTYKCITPPRGSEIVRPD